MKRILNVITVVLALILAACNERLDLTQVEGDAYIRLNLTVEPEMSNAPVTKGAFVADESTGEDVSIHDLWVLQFGGTTTDALLREARYIEDFDPAEAIKLIATSAVNRIILIANTFDSNLAFADCDNLGEFMEAFKPIADEADATRLVAGKRCPIMSAYKDMALTESGASVTFSLKRCICKANITIINNTLENSAPDVTIKGVTICSVPNKLFFYTSYELPDRFPAAASKDRIDYPDMEWTDGTEVDAKTRSFTFYLPVNKCGSVPEVSNPTMRSSHTPAGASYLRVLGTYADPADATMERAVEYRIPLGTTADDCNLLPGGKYTYTLTINDPSDRDADSRVAEDMLVDFCQKERANSYIINLPKATGAWKNYRIPVSRVFEFWNPSTGYFPDADNALLPGCNGWKADILWSEFLLEDDVNFKWIKQTGTDYQDYFEFALKEGAGEGNILIGVRRYVDAGQTELAAGFSWSWQMWVTDYNPNDAINYIPNVDGSGNELQFSYPVINGEVHRYNYSGWRTGIYRGRFIMDRNMGTLKAGGFVARKGSMYYQHGRKDPLRFGTSRFPHTVYNVLTGYGQRSVAITGTGLADNVPYSVNNPNVYLNGDRTGANWQCSYSYRASGCYWGDVRVIDDRTKSFFDPCPAGWMVPDKGFMDGNTSRITQGLEGKIVLSSKVTAYFPGCGWSPYPDRGNAVLYCSNWAAYNDFRGYAITSETYWDRNNLDALPVRCVTQRAFE